MLIAGHDLDAAAPNLLKNRARLVRSCRSLSGDTLPAPRRQYAGWPIHQVASGKGPSIPASREDGKKEELMSAQTG